MAASLIGTGLFPISVAEFDFRSGLFRRAELSVICLTAADSRHANLLNQTMRMVASSNNRRSRWNAKSICFRAMNLMPWLAA